LIFRSYISAFLSLGAAVAMLAFPSPGYAAGPSADVFFGYSHLGSDTFYSNVGGLNGWQLAVNYKVKHLVGIEGDVSRYGLGADSSVPRTTNVLFGPRLTVGAAGVKLFVHGLVGGEHSANSSSRHISGGAFTYALGGGVDFPLAPFFSWRVAADHLSAPTSSPSDGSHSRFSTGIVFRF